MKKWSYVFFLGFLLNFLWENIHSGLYIHYRGGTISQFILFRAAIVDALIILVLILVLERFNRSWLIILFGIGVAVVLEWFALYSGRWAYADMMPIIPIIQTGLTPTIQLGLTGYIVYRKIII